MPTRIRKTCFLSLLGLQSATNYKKYGSDAFSRHAEPYFSDKRCCSNKWNLFPHLVHDKIKWSVLHFLVYLAYILARDAQGKQNGAAHKPKGDEQ